MSIQYWQFTSYYHTLLLFFSLLLFFFFFSFFFGFAPTQIGRAALCKECTRRIQHFDDLKEFGSRSSALRNNLVYNIIPDKIQMHHNGKPSNRKKYIRRKIPCKCMLCQKEFQSKCYLHKHMKRHQNVKSAYKCMVCNSEFLSANSLSAHEKTHPTYKWDAVPFSSHYSKTAHIQRLYQCWRPTNFSFSTVRLSSSLIVDVFGWFPQNELHFFFCCYRFVWKQPMFMCLYDSCSYLNEGMQTVT